MSTFDCVRTSLVCGTILLATLDPCVGAEAATEGSVEFRVTTQAVSGEFAPRHVLAIWVVDDKGAFVKTLLRRANRRQRYLYTWRSASQGNAVDAVTGATLKDHQSHTVTWDSRDAKGSLVPDGEYRIRVESTSEHAQGPLTPEAHVAFTKGPKPVRVQPADLPHFTKMSLTYSPSAATQVLIAKGSSWRYRDDGIDLHASEWKTVGYDASGWKEGAAPLGFGDTVATLLGFGADESNKFPTYYFRREFDVDSIPTAVELRIRRDDGAVVYLNGVEVARENLPAGPTSYVLFATATVNDADELTYFRHECDPAKLTKGRNILAVELHESAPKSGDAGFDLELRATPRSAPPASDKDSASDKASDKAPTPSAGPRASAPPPR